MVIEAFAASASHTGIHFLTLINMTNVSSATLWNSEFALQVAQRIEGISGIYCGPAAVVWISAVWNATANVPYDYQTRLRDKKLFPDGPRSFSHFVPGFKSDLDQILRRETHGQLGLSTRRHYQYRDIHELIGSLQMPFIVRIPTASIRNGLHYVTLFKSVFTADNTFKCYWQDNGVFHSDEKMQHGISVSLRKSDRMAYFPWGARQVVKI